jgi:DNA-binding CsgD family transcriptional regulator
MLNKHLNMKQELTMFNTLNRKVVLGVTSLALAAVMVFAMFANVGATYAQGPVRQPGVGGGMVRRAVVQAVVKATNLTMVEITQQWASGKTLSEIITSNGGTVETVTADAKTTVTDALTKAVTNGRLTQAQADEQIAALDAAINTVLTTTFAEAGQNASQRVAELGVDLALFKATQDTTGLSRANLVTQLSADGATYASVIAANNATVDAVKTAATKIITDRLTQAVSNGRLAQKQADELLATLPAALDAAINAGLPDMLQQRNDNRNARVDNRLDARAFTELVKTTADQTGLTQREILQQLRDGKTLAEIATSKNIEPSAIVTATVTSYTALINQQVTDGRLTQEQADAQLKDLNQTLTDLMSKANPMQGNGGRPGRNAPNRPNATPEATPNA